MELRALKKWIMSNFWLLVIFLFMYL